MSWLPHPGLLPKWLLFVSTLAIYNSAQSFSTKMNQTQTRIYTLTTVSELASRLMGTWTFTSAIIRAYTAYNIDSRPLYDVCMWSFVIAFASFASEVFVYKTAKVSSPGVFSPFIVSTCSFIWMFMQRDYYVRN